MNPVILLEIEAGKVLIECFPELAPNHVKQILELANAGHYDGAVFHRVIPGFMAQGGHTGKPVPAMTAEFNSYPHVEGTCSMARTNDPNSASDQFFICFADARFLDNQYTVWGKVMYGMNLIHDGIAKGEPPANPTIIGRMRQVDISKLFD